MKPIVSIDNWNKLSNRENKRMQNIKLEGEISPWIGDSRPKCGTFWELYSIIKLPGMGLDTIDEIREIDENVLTVKDL